jgi:hypothetical protein
MVSIGRYACCTKGKWPDKLHAVRLAPSALIAEVALKHKEVAVTLTPPLTGFGFLSTSLAPKEEKPQVPELRIHVRYDLGAYYLPSVAEGRATYAVSAGTPHTLAPGCAGVLAKADDAAAHTPGKGRSEKRGATAFNQCS